MYFFYACRVVYVDEYPWEELLDEESGKVMR